MRLRAAIRTGATAVRLRRAIVARDVHVRLLVVFAAVVEAAGAICARAAAAGAAANLGVACSGRAIIASGGMRRRLTAIAAIPTGDTIPAGDTIPTGDTTHGRPVVTARYGA